MSWSVIVVAKLEMLSGNEIVLLHEEIEEQDSVRPRVNADFRSIFLRATFEDSWYKLLRVKLWNFVT